MRESNKLVLLYTERFGLIYGTLQSIRELKSKMKFHTQTLSLVDVDIIQGRDIWRIVGIHEREPSLGFVGTPFYPFMNNIADLLLRMLQGEESHTEIWDDLLFLYTTAKDTLTESDYQALEIIVVVRLLYYLGYWNGDTECIEPNNFLTTELFNTVLNNRKKYIQSINQGIKDSQL